MSGAIFTVGHSTHEWPMFLKLLQRWHVTAVADVRSIPASRHTPQFNRNTLAQRLSANGVKYVFLGKQLGARTDDLNCYVNGKVQYERLAQTATFDEGIKRLLQGARTERIAVMCSEAEPLECHRAVLVARVLTERGAHVDHIRRDGEIESHPTAMQRLMRQYGMYQADLFHTPDELLNEALARQEQRIAYVNPELEIGGSAWQ